MSDKERCENCGTLIGNLETPFVWQQKVVCNQCFARLAKGGPRTSQKTGIWLLGCLIVVAVLAFITFMVMPKKPHSKAVAQNVSVVSGTDSSSPHPAINNLSMAEAEAEAKIVASLLVDDQKSLESKNRIASDNVGIHKVVCEPTIASIDVRRSDSLAFPQQAFVRIKIYFSTSQTVGGQLQSMFSIARMYSVALGNATDGSWRCVEAECKIESDDVYPKDNSYHTDTTGQVKDATDYINRLIAKTKQG